MRLVDITPADQAARIRAAIGYSGKEMQDIAAELGVSIATIRRRTARLGPTGASSIEELYAIADICGVPNSFMDEGFERFHGAQGALDGRIRALQREMRRQGATLEQDTRRQAAELRDALNESIRDGLAAREDLSTGLDQLRGQIDSLRDELGLSVRAAEDEAAGQSQQPSEPDRRRGQGPGRGE